MSSNKKTYKMVVAGPFKDIGGLGLTIDPELEPSIERKFRKYDRGEDGKPKNSSAAFNMTCGVMSIRGITHVTFLKIGPEVTRTSLYNFGVSMIEEEGGEVQSMYDPIPGYFMFEQAQAAREEIE